ncbi:MAG: threonylcarbamoyl-AMP synthase [Bacteroidetes bacterium]|nr:threonylcarbamoyl-AMP synthase [Bacteroidota bacterium]
MTCIIHFSEQIPAALIKSTDEVISNIVNALRLGKIILYPTDTIWGFGCDPFNEKAVDRIFTIKKRKKEKSFILLVDSIKMLKRYVREIPTQLLSLIDNQEAPVTAVYGNTNGLPKHLLAEDGTVAIRIVQNEWIKQIIKLFDAPLVSTSANTSGQSPPPDFKSLEKEILKATDLVVTEDFDTSTVSTPSRMVVVTDEGTLHWIR